MFQKLFLRRVREVKVCTISKGEGHVGQEKDTFPGSLLKGGGEWPQKVRTGKKDLRGQKETKKPCGGRKSPKKTKKGLK